jgi:hypothetical protein
MNIQLIDFWEYDYQIKNLCEIIEKNTNSKVTLSSHPNITSDLIIYSCFGTNHKNNKFEKTLKVYYTGENKRPHKSANLNLTFDYTLEHNNIRFPLWYLYINWYSQTIPMPFNHINKILQKPSFEEMSKTKTKFCVFIAGHSRNCPRAHFTQMLHNKYKHVDCAGRCLNNIGRILGGKESKKIEYMRPYKFCIAFENSQYPGYCTEKILHAFLAGCIPIYWGDPKVGNDFNDKSFLHLQSHDGSEMLEMIEKIKEIDQNDDLWRKMYEEVSFKKTHEEMLEKLKELGMELQKLIG